MDTKAKRKLMKAQRRQRVLEPYASSDSSSDEDNLARSARREFEGYSKVLELLKEFDYDIEGASDVDP